MDIKITKSTETIDNYTTFKKELTKFFANGILVVECVKSRDYFATLKNGVPSHIRNNIKNTYKTKWNKTGLREVVKTDMFTQDDFKNDAPDLQYGYQGTVLSPKKVKEAIEFFIDKYLETI